MHTELRTQNVDLTEKIEKTITGNSVGNDGQYLEIINELINWDDIIDTIKRNVSILSKDEFENCNIRLFIKCLALKEILGYSDTELPREISTKEIYRDFIGIKSEIDIPCVELISTFHENLIEEGLFGTVIIKIRKYLSDAKMKIIENIVKKDIVKLNASASDVLDEAGISDHVILEIEEILKILYEKIIDSVFMEVRRDKSQDIKEKLTIVKTQIEKVFAKNSNKKSSNFRKLLNIEQSIYNIYKIALKFEEDIKVQKPNTHEKKQVAENKEIQLFNPFYKALDEYMMSMNDNNLENKVASENVISNKLKSADDTRKEFIDGISVMNEFTSSDLDDAKEEITPKPQQEENMQRSEVDFVETESEKDEEPFFLNPGIKKEGIFNDENLTEDYELGFRFHQLGLKMGFFNVKLDRNKESSRISTAEFFPNKFWPSVKQRSRWIAGICLQNWKINKWQGNLSTKYFLFRDRKPLFSLFGAFFSNIVLLYLVYTAIAGNFFDTTINPLLDSSSVLIYLVFANMFFMVSRASHRFIFTYNWYGFKYAFFSLFRLIIDTFINFFAVLRALKVFRQTKKKVVWDSTTHY